VKTNTTHQKKKKKKKKEQNNKKERKKKRKVHEGIKDDCRKNCGGCSLFEWGEGNA